MEDNTLLYFIRRSTEFLERKGISSPRLEAEVLISYVLELPRIQLYARFDMILQDSEKEEYRNLIKQRADNIPTAYILGKKNFYGFDFIVNPSVLIPRPETEELVEYAIKNLLTEKSSATVLDLCSGSGCIGITVQKLVDTAKVEFLDISQDAIATAKKNYQSILQKTTDMSIPQESDSKFLDSIFHTSNLYANLPLEKKYDLILSNPPYVLPEEESELSLEVLKEPRIALIVEDFHEFHKNLLQGSKERLLPGGSILIETNPLEIQKLNDLATQIGFQTKIIYDISKKPRFLLGNIL